LARVLDAGKKTGTPVGIHTQSTSDAQRRIEQGWRFMAIGSELSMMLSEAQRIVGEMKPQEKAEDLVRY
ncbi:MAG TPA: 2-dehydro-3-deoxyglucarate aldolase, partial [Planctomicrobium sp.]|nr:2-dehydro-3-deoxyglucarate aldolase [Planctomicrobium sp.]